ncbi:MAG: DNA starvation/stationary phase protection protein [Acidimicrobiia bacterium]|nr:DNA starvation/stationary phase protection protein [Acidimicrobiia bacterium]
MPNRFTVPGLEPAKGQATATLLQERLLALLDLSLVLKHVHWNVVGPTFIGVHEMLDPQVDAVRVMVDDTAERIATLGGEPNGLPGNLVARRAWDDYEVGRAAVPEHLGALDLVYNGVISNHRAAIEQLVALDPVTQDMVIEQTEQLEQFQWFVRAHLETGAGELATKGAKTERQAAAKASRSTTTATSNGSRTTRARSSTTKAAPKRTTTKRS